ncbi:Ig-like domain-containing protein [Treponema sp.]|uniref:Ig-like domain-containing protein n=1 Tax=Treponema sp. TaxID=166 RepID=UPI00388FE134
MKLIKILLFAYVAILSSCKILTFNDRTIECSISGNDKFFEGETISFIFSDSCNRKEAEDSICLYENSTTVDVEYSWTQNSIAVKPRKGWCKGKFYILIFDGSIRIDGQMVQSYIKRTFYYGVESSMTYIIEENIKYPDNLKASLEIPFTKEIDPDSVHDIIIYPSTEFEKELSDDSHCLIISPKNRWAPNIFYEIKICNLLSQNSYHFEDRKLTFKVMKDTEIPELSLVCRAIKNSDGYILMEKTESLNELKKNDSIGFKFSKPMDFDSIKKGITFSPYLEGQFISMDIENRNFVFVPESDYKEKQKYEIYISKKITDLNGIELYEKLEFSFIPVYEYIKIQEIKINDSIIDLLDSKESCKFLPSIKSITTNDVAEEQYSALFMISFTSEFSKEEIKSAADRIKLSIKFPLTVQSPTLRSINWISGSRIIMEYDNFKISEFDSPVFYELKIQGGQSGIINQFNEYLEETECFILEPSLD